MKTLRGNLVAGKREKRRSKETHESTKGAGRAVIGRSWRIRLRGPFERSQRRRSLAVELWGRTTRCLKAQPSEVLIKPRPEVVNRTVAAFHRSWVNNNNNKQLRARRPYLEEFFLEVVPVSL